MPAKRRSSLEILGEILKSVSTERLTKTTITYRANINFSQMRRHLDFLLERDLIKEVKEGERVKYTITERGKLFLDSYLTLEKLKEKPKPRIPSE